MNTSSPCSAKASACFSINARFSLIKPTSVAPSVASGHEVPASVGVNSRSRSPVETSLSSDNSASNVLSLEVRSFSTATILSCKSSDTSPTHKSSTSVNALTLVIALGNLTSLGRRVRPRMRAVS